MSRNNARRCALSILFVFLLCFGILWVDAAVRPNEDRDGIWKTYKSLDENSVDVLLTGSSKIHANINPIVMWKSEGFTSYDISGSSMDLTTTYYYLREAFRTQHPKIVVIDILLLGNGYTSLDDIQMRNIMTMPFGINKIMASMSPFVSPPLREQVLIPIKTFHSRMLTPGHVTGASMLNRLYSKEAPNIFMGYRYLNTNQVFSPNTQVRKLDVHRFEQRYRELSQSLDFLKNQHCKVLLVNTPSNSLPELEEYENALIGRAKGEYSNVSFFFPRDYKDVFKIDYQTEMLDQTHLNAKGAQRFSKYFAKELKSRYADGLRKTQASLKTTQTYKIDYERYQRAKNGAIAY